ncbi:MAG: gamma-glutamyltransferase [bacterium]|nr:gamma-glutamyltransferase [bacterium]
MNKLSFRFIFLLSLFFLFVWRINLPAEEFNDNSGMVVSAHPLASEVGNEILKSGGNAIDAAVASALAVGVVEPNGSGLGGGGAMLIYLSEPDSLTYINYYVSAPASIAQDFNSRRESASARSVLVPGTVAGLSYALEKYGTITWQELVNRVIQKVGDGFIVNELFYQAILESYDKLLQHPQTQAIYFDNDLPPEIGTRLENPLLIQTLQKLADQGPEIFYRGEIADSIESIMIRENGTLRKSDLTAYQVREMQPLKGIYRGYKIFSAPPAQSGITLIEALNIFELKNLHGMGDYATNPKTFHFMAETFKRVYADRTEYLGDPNFVPVPVDILISKEFARSRFLTIDMEKVENVPPNQKPAGDVTPFQKKPNPELDDPKGSTTHISVIDANGNAVSLTQTLNYFWGSGISVCGFLLNNGMTSFSGSNEAVNQVAPGKQPRTTIAPTMLFEDGKLFMVIGSPGAGRIISTLAEVIANVIDFEMDADSANNAPRFYSRRWGEKLPIENRFPDDVRNKLESMGYEFEIMGAMDMFFGGVQLILIDHEAGKIIGSSDPRRSGAATEF